MIRNFKFTIKYRIIIILFLLFIHLTLLKQENHDILDVNITWSITD